MPKNDPLELNISGLRSKLKNRLGEVNCIHKLKIAPMGASELHAVRAVGGCQRFWPLNTY